MKKVLDYIFPRRCPVCHDAVSKRGCLICPECEKKLSYVSAPRCLKCGKEISDETRDVCYDCENYPKSFIKNFTVFNYDEVMRQSMVMFKYKGRREYAEFYADELLRFCEKGLKAADIKLIIPVPVHKSRLETRGYNQAAEIATIISKKLEIPMREDILVRDKETEAQKSLGVSGRLQNIAQSMTVKYALDKAGNILLVDDIYTTGATLAACARTLQKAGAKNIYCATICVGRDS